MVSAAIVEAGNGVLGNQDRAVIATQLQSTYHQLIALANSKDGDGKYLFSGGQDATAPFTVTANGATYNGDQGQRLIQVSASRQLAASDNGSDLFERVRTGNGVFATSGGATNAGTGIINLGAVSNPGALTGHNYQIQFNVSAGATTYDVVDTTASTTVSAGNAFTSGGPISFAGMQMSIEGAPVAGDTFNVSPSATQSVFSTLAGAIALLNTSASTDGARARLAMGLSQSMANLDHAFDKLQITHTDVGTRMAEVDALAAVNSNQSLVYKTDLSRQRDVDYTASISELNAQQQSLTAAQQSYAKITKLSLFDFI